MMDRYGKTYKLGSSAAMRLEPPFSGFKEGKYRRPVFPLMEEYLNEHGEAEMIMTADDYFDSSLLEADKVDAYLNGQDEVILEVDGNGWVITEAQADKLKSALEVVLRELDDLHAENDAQWCMMYNENKGLGPDR